MLLIRVVVLIVAITLGVAVGFYIFTGDRRWLRFAWQIFKYALFVVVLVLLLLAGERLLVAV